MSIFLFFSSKWESNKTQIPGRVTNKGTGNGKKGSFMEAVASLSPLKLKLVASRFVVLSIAHHMLCWITLRDSLVIPSNVHSL